MSGQATSATHCQLHMIRDLEAQLDRVVVQLGSLYLMVVRPVGPDYSVNDAIQSAWTGVGCFLTHDSTSYQPASLRDGLMVQVHYWTHEMYCAVTQLPVERELHLCQPPNLPQEAAAAFYSLVRKLHEERQQADLMSGVVGEA